MAVTSSYAAEGDIYTDKQAGAFIVYSQNTIGSENNETMSSESGDKDLLQQSLIDGSTSATPKPLVKVGQGVYEIDEDITVVNPLVVREGTVRVTGDVTSMMKSPLSSYVPFLSVGGKNAVLELDAATVTHSMKNTNNFCVAMSLGGPDGKATINLKNGSTLHTDHFIMAGDPDGQMYTLTQWGTSPAEYAVLGTGYSKGTIDADTIDPETGKGTFYSEGDKGQTVINIEGGSTLSAGTSLQFGDVAVTISGVGSLLTDNTRNLQNSSNHCSYLGHEGSYEGKMETKLNIEKGGAFVSNWNLVTGGTERAVNTPETVVDITVGSGSEEGKTSTFTVKGHFAMGDNLGVNKIASSKSTTKFTVKNGAEAYLNIVTVGDEGKADMIVEKGGKILQVDEEERFNYQPSGDTFANPVICVNEKGSLSNSGLIALDVELNGGIFTMNDGAVAAGLTATSGSIYLNGNVTFTGAVNLGTVASAVSLFGGETEALTVYIQQGSTVTLDTDSIEVDGQTFTVGEGTQFIVDLADGEIYEEGTQLFTLASANETLLASASQAIADKTTVTWTTQDGEEQKAGYGAVDTPLHTGSIATVAIPEPTTATLSLLALAGLCARRRRA